jgi:hypothetical protein
MWRDSVRGSETPGSAKQPPAESRFGDLYDTTHGFDEKFEEM